MRHLLLAAAVLYGCAANIQHTPNLVEPTEWSPDLIEKKNYYCEMARPGVESRGWASSEGDGLLFTALHSVACGYPGIDAFCDADGRCYRDPAQTPLSGTWRSTFSKDMSMGVIVYAALANEIEPLNRWILYGDAHAWLVGDAVENEIGLVIMPPTVVHLAFDVREFLNNSNLRASPDDPYIYREGYQAHLAVLRQLVESKINGGLTDWSLDLLRREADRQPRNPLFQCAMGLYDESYRRRGMALLMEETQLWPADRLPTSDNYCTHYLLQRDDDSGASDGSSNPDWLPCPPDKVDGIQDGTDFVFAAHVCLGDL